MNIIYKLILYFFNKSIFLFFNNYIEITYFYNSLIIIIFFKVIFQFKIYKSNKNFGNNNEYLIYLIESINYLFNIINYIFINDIRIIIIWFVIFFISFIVYFKNSNKKLIVLNSLILLSFFLKKFGYTINFILINFLICFSIFFILIVIFSYIILIKDNNQIYVIKGAIYFILYNLIIAFSFILIIYFYFNDNSNVNLWYTNTFLIIEELIFIYVFILLFKYNNYILKFYSDEIYIKYKLKNIFVNYFKNQFCYIIYKKSQLYFSQKQIIVKDNEITINNCLICLSSNSEYLLYPCNHLIFCGDCILQYLNLWNVNCPYCKIKFKKILKIIKIQNNEYKVYGQLFIN